MAAGHTLLSEINTDKQALNSIFQFLKHQNLKVSLIIIILCECMYMYFLYVLICYGCYTAIKSGLQLV